MHASDLLTAAILGIVEGLTEFIPVSSTGHLLITEKLIPQWAPPQSDLFNIVIQCGAVIAVLPLFANRLRQMLFGWREPATRDFIAKLFTAFCLTGILGYILEKRGFKLPETVYPVALALVIGGILFLLIERWIRNKPRSNELTWKIAIAIGLAQIVAAVFPGTSRSGSTIMIALIFGLSRPAATEFSFLVGIPTMLAAGGYKIFKALHHPPPDMPPENWHLLALTTIISAIVSFIAVKWLLRYVQTHSFNSFGWYRIVVGAALLALCLLGVVS